MDDLDAEKMLADVLNESLEYFKKSFISFILAVLIAGLGSIFVIPAAPLFFGVYVMAHLLINNKEISYGSLFKGFDHFLLSWALFLFAGFAILFGLIFLIIPGLFLMVVLQYAPCIALIEGKGALESLKRSYQLGVKYISFSVALAIVLWVINSIGGALSVGILLTYPYSVICYMVASKKLIEESSDVGHIP